LTIFKEVLFVIEDFEVVSVLCGGSNERSVSMTPSSVAQVRELFEK